MGGRPDVWNYDEMVHTHAGYMEQHWKGHMHKTVLRPYRYPYG